jgi:ferrous iron transport protein A
MSLQEAAQTRTIPVRSFNGRANRLLARLRSVLGRAIESIGNSRTRPVNGVKAGSGTWSAQGAVPADGIVKLGRSDKGVRGTVVRLSTEMNGFSGGIAAEELERRLLEIGFVEGAAVEILHEGFIRRDPIAVRLDDMRVALRRCDADAILVRVNGASAPVSAGE